MHLHTSGFGLDEPDDGVGHRRASRTVEADQADTLTGSQRDGHPLHGTGTRAHHEIRHFQQLATGLAARLHRFDFGHPSRWGAADHRRHEVRLADLGYLACQHESAVTEHAHPVADLVDLLEVVGDVQDANAAFAHAAHPVEEALD